MSELTESEFLKAVAGHVMTVQRNDGVHRFIRFKNPDTFNCHFDLITWPGHLCYTGDMGTYVFSRLSDMFAFFRTDRMQQKNGRTLFVNHGYWAEKVLAYDKNGKIEEYDREVAEQRLRDALRDLRRHGNKTSQERGDIYEECMMAIEEEGAFHDALSEHFTDTWEWSLRDYTYSYQWCCFAIAWGIQQYDALPLTVTT